MLKKAKTKYSFCNFENYERFDRFIILRHDIDFSVHSALALAEIEKEEGITSTYFIHLHNMFYNALETEITSLFRKIFSAGHKPGLHFDCSYYQINDEKSLEEKLSYEKNIIENITGLDCKAFSFHNPDDKTIETFGKNSYAGLINAYGKHFRQFGYCSDSNGYWRFERLEDILIKDRYDKLQVLIHPAWWQDVPMSPRKRIWRCIDGRAEKTKKKYIQELEKFGRMVIDDE